MPAATTVAWAASAVARLPLELLGLAQIAVRESDRSESGESERRVVAEPDSPGELERALRIHRGRVFRVLGRPRFEQQHRAKRVVSDRVRMTAGDRGPRGDGRDVAGVRRTDCANEAARRDAPVVSSRLERGGRVVRQRASAFDVARLPKGERASVERSRAAMVPQRSRQARRAFAGHERGTEIELFGCDVAEVGAARSATRPERHRPWPRASSRKRRPSETRSWPARTNVPSRTATAGSGASRM